MQGNRTVTANVQLACTTTQAIDLFINKMHLANWWGVERSFIDAQRGGAYTLCWGVSDHGFKYVSTGRIENIQSNELRIIHMQYLNPDFPILGPMTMHIDAKKNAEGCTLTVTQGGYQEGPDWDWYYEAVNTAWPEVLKSINNYVSNLQ